MRLDELVARLPGNATCVVAESTLHTALETSPAEIAGYIPPSFNEISWPAKARVLLIEAAGAVGKTSAAQVIARQTKWPLVRAERAQVGSYSLSGLVQDSLGFDSIYLQQIAAGTAGLVVDSLDEAHLLAGTQNFLAFLENVQNISRLHSNDELASPTIILMSRSDTAELIQLAFADRGIEIAHVRLDFFDRLSAEKFVVEYLRKRFIEVGKSEYNVALASPVPFGQLRRTRFEQLLTAITRNVNSDIDRDWNAGKDFVGYAPVLIALAESLAVSNPGAERGKIGTKDDPSLTGLLLEIINKILVREHEKFVNQLKDKLTALLPAAEEFNGFEYLYSRGEQITRIFSLVSGTSISHNFDHGLSGQSAVEYGVAASQFTAEHPFVRNREYASVVFRDYVQASVTLEADLRRRFATDPCLAVTDVGAFFLDFSGSLIALNSAPVPEGLLNALLKSWYAQMELIGSPDSDAVLFLGEEWGGLTLKSGGDEQATSIDFTISELTGAPTIKVALRNIAVICEQGLILGSKDYATILGPNVLVSASEIEIEADSVNLIGGGKPTGSVLVSAGRIRADRLSRVGGATSSLKVLTTEPPAQLRPFVGTKSDMSLREVPFEDYVALRALLSSFRSTVHMGLCATKDRIESIVSANPVRQAIIRALRIRGVVVEVTGWYKLDSSALKLLGFNFIDVRGGAPTKPMLDFLAQCRYESTNQ